VTARRTSTTFELPTKDTFCAGVRSLNLQVGRSFDDVSAPRADSHGLHTHGPPWRGPSVPHGSVKESCRNAFIIFSMLGRVNTVTTTHTSLRQTRSTQAAMQPPFRVLAARGKLIWMGTIMRPKTLFCSLVATGRPEEHVVMRISNTAVFFGHTAIYVYSFTRLHSNDNGC
jgi:hypothetical protein